MISNADITLFNKRYDSETRQDKFLPTVIKGVSLYISKGSTGDFQNRSGKATYKVRIPINADTGGKQYIDQVGYKALTDEEVSGFWTLQPDCIIVPAIADEAEDISITELTSKYGSVITVTDFSDNTTRGVEPMKHWRVGGE